MKRALQNQQPRQLDFSELLGPDSKPSESSANIDELLLPGVPADLIRCSYDQAPGNEIENGKFSHPESSAALVGNTFGLFLERPGDLPVIPHCESWWSPASLVSLEATLQFPWQKGRHPCVDVLAITERAVFAIESKRFEPYRERLPPTFSDAYWRNVWGTQMDGYEFIRDILKGCGCLFDRLDAAQLVKHALGLRTAMHRESDLRKKAAVLVYLYAEPKIWPDGRCIPPSDFELHRKEISRFAKCVAGSEVHFIPIAYKELLSAWVSSTIPRVQQHARAVAKRYAV